MDIDKDAGRVAIESTQLLGVCAVCSTQVRKDQMLCLGCCCKQKPVGPPLKRCRKFGFRVSYHQRQMMNEARDMGAIPTEVDAESCGVKMSHLYVAVDGKTYVGHEWIEQGGCSFSWSELYTPNVCLSLFRKLYSTS